MVSRSESRSSRSFSNNLRRSYPYNSNWSNSLADPFAARTTAIFRYTEFIALDGTISGNATHVYRANSIYDPSYTGVGHQPYGHDQYAAIYENYRVKSATIVVTTTSQASNGILGVSLRATPTTIADPASACELKATKSTPLVVSRDPIKVSQNWRLSDQTTSDGCEALFGANPGTEMYFHVFVGGNSASEPSSQGLRVDITYIAECWEPKNLGSS